MDSRTSVEVGHIILAFVRKNFQGESLLVDKHSVFGFFVLRVESQAIGIWD